jgi:hypothetical protein
LGGRSRQQTHNLLSHTYNVKHAADSTGKWEGRSGEKEKKNISDIKKKECKKEKK